MSKFTHRLEFKEAELGMFILQLRDNTFYLEEREALYLAGLITQELGIEDHCDNCCNLGYFKNDDEILACDFCYALATDEEAQDLAAEEGVLG